MENRINESEYRFMDLLWEVEPIPSMQLVKVCNEKLGWKKSTTYTVIRNLSEKNIVSNENTIVRTLVTRDEVQRQESREFVQKKFRGSLPAFIATFLRDEKLSKEEAQSIQKLIDDAVEGED